MQRFRRVAPLSLLLLLPLCSIAQGNSPLEGSPFTATPDQLRAVAGSRPPIAGAAATILYEEIAFRIAADRTLRYSHRWVYRIDSQEGVENWAESSMQWDPWYQKPAEIHARILLPGGQFVELDPKTITDAPINSDEQGTYTSARIRKAPLPGFTIGSIVEEQTETEDKRAFSTTGSAYRVVFPDSVPVGLKKVSVELPSAMPFKDDVEFLPGATIQRSEQDGIRRVTYEQADVPKTVASDIDLNTSVARTPAVNFSTGSSWAATAKEYAAISNPVFEGDAPAKSAVTALLPRADSNGTAADRMKTIRALVERLHKDVRYTGVEFNEAQWVPEPPSETLKRHYGDCKDKAALLVAMLRASNIPAYLALLDAGPGRDIRPDMPALNHFDHAIVYVPASGGGAALWIDATASYFEVGSLPYGDTGRLALIIAPETTGLVRTPEATPENSVVVETREFTLPDFGHGSVIEKSETHGFVDADYRSLYGGAISEKTHKDLENYARNAYLAKQLKSIDHTDGSDLSKPFELKLTVEDARRGATSLIDAAVGVFPTGTLNQLPSWFSKEPEVVDGTEEQKKRFADALAQRSDSYDIQPFISEQRFRIHFPAGFVLSAQPEDKVTPIGPGSLTESYHLESPTLMTASLRFTTGKSHLTTAEALAMRDAVLVLNKRSMVLISFDEVGVKLIAAGKPREALDAERAALKQQPNAALPHVHFAQALLKVGVGEKAKEEATLATKLDPNSYVAFATLGWVLEHNQLGVRFGKGFERDAAVAAYRKSVTLHPEDENYWFDLAILEEFDIHGVRYADPAGVAAAIKDYQKLIEDNPASDSLAQYQDNELYALLLTRRFAEVDAMLAKLPVDANRAAIGLVSAIAQHGAAAGLAQPDRAAKAERSSQLNTAGSLLARMGMYSEAAEVLKAGLQDQPDVPAVARQLELFRTLKKCPTDLPPGTDPTDPLRTTMVAMVSDKFTPELAASITTRHAYLSDVQWQRSLKKTIESAGMLTRLAATSGMAESVLGDVILSNLKLTATGDDRTGYSVVMQSLGTSPSSFYTVKENGKYVGAASDSDDYEVGAYTLYLLDGKQYAAARALLNWKRDQVKRGNSDDALAGPLLPRFWKPSTNEADATAEAMRLAAIALLSRSPDVRPLVPFVVEVYSAIKPDAPHAEQRRTDLNLLLAICYISTAQGAPALQAAAELLKEEPDSNTAIGLAGSAYAFEKNFAGWNSMLTPKVAAKPTDPELLYHQSRLFAMEGDFKGARTSARKALDSGHATEENYNYYAWLGLFSNDLGKETTDAAQQANMLSKNSNFAPLHTMASIYAAQGRINEAREVLLQAMSAANLSLPNSECWYVIGVMDKQLGIDDAALAAFRKVEAPEGAQLADATGTWTLAQQAIAELNGSGGASHAR